MAGQEPFVGSDRRPDMRLGLDRPIADVTLAEVKMLLSRNRLKAVADAIAEKDVTADKQSADSKLSNDIKSNNDKMAKDLKDTNILVIDDLTTGGTRIEEFFRRLLTGLRRTGG